MCMCRVYMHATIPPVPPYIYSILYVLRATYIHIWTTSAVGQLQLGVIRVHDVIVITHL